MMNDMPQISQALLESSVCAVLCHVDPDGDALGSALALKGALDKLGKTAVVACASPIPRLYARLPGAMQVLHTEEEVIAAIGVPDTVIALDTASEARLGGLDTLAANALRYICIDHHVSNPGFAKLNWIADYAAVGEMLVSFIQTLGVPLDIDMAACLYVAIITDTGSFLFPNTTIRTHHAAAQVMETGLSVVEWNDWLFRTRSRGQVQILGRALSQLTFHYDGKVSFMPVTLADLKDCEALNSDCENIINYGREIEGVQVALLLREKEANHWKASVRTTGQIDASQIAKKFGGGGHKQAAGCDIDGTFEQAQHALLDAIADCMT